jgi:hypothetical protein
VIIIIIMSLDTSTSSLRRLAEQRLDSLRGSASTFTTPLQKTSHAEMRTFLTQFYESIWTAEKRKFYEDEMQHYPQLKELYQELVLLQKKLTYEDFWQRYEYRCDLSRVIHGILQRDDPDWMKTATDPSQSTATKTTVSQSYAPPILQGPSNTNTPPRTNLNDRSQFTERPIRGTAESKMDNNHSSSQPLVTKVEGKVKEEGAQRTGLVDTKFPLTEASPSPSPDGETARQNHGGDNRTETRTSGSSDKQAGPVVDEFHWKEVKTVDGSVSQGSLNDELANFDRMVNDSTNTLMLSGTPRDGIEACWDSDTASNSRNGRRSPKHHVDAGGKDATIVAVDHVKKRPNAAVAFWLKCTLVFSFLVASIVGLAAFVAVRDGVVSFDHLCTPLPPGRDVTVLDIANTTKFSAPWWAPEEWKETSFSVLCAPAGFFRTEIQVDWNAKKRFMGISVVDLEKYQSLLTLKQLRSFQVLPETLQIRAETTRGRVTVNTAPWSKRRSHDVA